MIKTVLITLLLAFSLAPALAPASQDGSASSADKQSLAETVNINTADADTLEQRLVGIGRNKALAIVAHREKFGRFYAAEELSAVRGIGPSTVAKNKTRIVVEE